MSQPSVRTPRPSIATRRRNSGLDSGLNSGWLVAMVAFLIHAVAAQSRAQYNEYKLGASGEWVQTNAADPNSPQAVMAQARRHLAEDRPEQAQTLLSSWIKQHERSGSEYLPEALQLRGDAQTMLGDEYEALYDYERVTKEFVGSEFFIVAIERELDIGVRYLQGYRRKFMGARILNSEDVGEELLIRVQERLPGSRLGERAGIELADYYYRTHELALAVEAYDLFLRNYPNSQYHMKAMQRRVYATIARYKGPRYDGAALLDTTILIRRFRNLYPAQATQGGLDDALLARIDESIAAELYESARWYMKQGDEAGARYVLMRVVRERPRTAAASAAYRFMLDRGWIVAEGEPESGSVPTSGASSGEGPAATRAEPEANDSSGSGRNDAEQKETTK